MEPTGRLVTQGALGMVLVGSSVAVSHALVGSPLLVAQGLRYALAAVLLLAVARLRGVVLVRPTGTEWLWLLGVALTGLVVFNLALVHGVAHAEPAVIAVAVACAPVAIGLVGPLLEARTPRPRLVAAAVVVTAGSGLVIGTGRTDATGVACAVVALACEAAFTLLAVPVLPRHGAWGVSVHAVWLAAAVLLVSGLVVEGPTAVTRIGPAAWLALLHLAVLVTAVAFVLWYGAVAGLGSGRAALLCGVAPVAAAAVGVATTHDVPGPGTWLGLAVVLAGLGLGLGDQPRPAPAASASAASSCVRAPAAAAGPAAARSCHSG